MWTLHLKQNCILIFEFFSKSEPLFVYKVYHNRDLDWKWRLTFDLKQFCVLFCFGFLHLKLFLFSLEVVEEYEDVVYLKVVEASLPLLALVSLQHWRGQWQKYQVREVGCNGVESENWESGIGTYMANNSSHTVLIVFGCSCCWYMDHIYGLLK